MTYHTRKFNVVWHAKFIRNFACYWITRTTNRKNKMSLWLFFFRHTADVGLTMQALECICDIFISLLALAKNDKRANENFQWYIYISNGNLLNSALKTKNLPSRELPCTYSLVRVTSGLPSKIWRNQTVNSYSHENRFKIKRNSSFFPPMANLLFEHLPPDV